MDIIKIILAFIVLINPFSALSVYLDLTRDYGKKERKRVAQVAALSVFIVIVIFALTGNMLLRFLGISTGSFQVGGGILVFLIAVSMVNGGTNPAKPDIGTSEDSEIMIQRQSRPNVGEIAVVPLAIPMMIGPGGISTVVIYTATANSYADLVGVIVAGAIIAFICYLSLRAAAKVSNLLGQTGLTILNRVMGILLAAVAIEIIVAGLKNIFPQLLS